MIYFTYIVSCHLFYYFLFRVALVIVTGNRVGDPGSNPRLACWCFTCHQYPGGKQESIYSTHHDHIY